MLTHPPPINSNLRLGYGIVMFCRNNFSVWKMFNILTTQLRQYFQEAHVYDKLRDPQAACSSHNGLSFGGLTRCI